MHQYDQVLAQLTAYEAQPDYAQSQNRNAAKYLKAYTYFNQKSYANAQPLYSAYASVVEHENKTYPDALNRIGDCHFYSREFNKAIQAYAQVAEIGDSGADYALLQKAYAEGLIHQYDQKVNTLSKLVEDYPRSDLADDALYEMARAQLQLNEYAAAITCYTKLLSHYPNSNKGAKSSLELGRAQGQVTIILRVANTTKFHIGRSFLKIWIICSL